VGYNVVTVLYILSMLKVGKKVGNKKMSTNVIKLRIPSSGIDYYLRFIVIFMVLILFLYSGIFADSSSGLNAGVLKCHICGKKIRGKYIKDSKGRVYCSKECYRKSLPKCVVCGRPAGMKTGGKYYCSNKCLKTTWRKCCICGKLTNKGVLRGYLRKFLCMECASKPKCFACSMPGEYELADGRYLCKDCYKSAIFDYDTAIEIANDIRGKIKENLLLSTGHKIDYHLVTLFELKKKNSSVRVTELGLFKFSMLVQKRIRTVKKGSVEKREISRNISDEHYDIYLLTGMPKKKLQEVVAHELGHDWMQENFPNIEEDLIREGWAEYLASEVNKLLGHGAMNIRMEKNSDAVYGQGYRMIRKYVEENGINALMEFFKEKNAKNKTK